MKLTAEHIYAYMPYGLQIKYPDSGKIYTVEVIDEADYINNEYPLSTVIHCIETQELQPLSFKLLLKPLSELTDELLNDISAIDGINGVEAVIEKVRLGLISHINMTILSRERYDVFGLIENGLAEVKE